ncbi:MAG: transposase [Kiritimatiellae bacterium]|nr:transposase [Kiritimatiellia bacterium]
MKKHPYNPKLHHRRSIRLKGHDYAGGGAYFVTICAFRDAGDIFADAAVKEMVGRVWEELPGSAVGASLLDAHSEGRHKACPYPPEDAPLVDALSEGRHKACPYSVMPDHFHGIVRMRGGKKALGDVVGAFKSLVVQEYVAGVKANRFAPFPGKIWHRNYYERIIRNAEEFARVANYIRMNPWRLIIEGAHEGRPYRMIGNPALLNRPKIGMLCSRDCPPQALAAAEERASAAHAHHCIMSGFHSRPEKAILAALLQSQAKIICCPAWGIEAMKIPADWLPALEQNRMLILEMKNDAGDLAAASERNAFVLQRAEKLWIPYASPDGMVARLVRDWNVARS